MLRDLFDPVLPGVIHDWMALIRHESRTPSVCHLADGGEHRGRQRRRTRIDPTCDDKKGKRKYRKKYRAKVAECLKLTARNQAMRDEIVDLKAKLLAKVDECLELTARNQAMRDEIVDLEAKLLANAARFMTKAFKVECILHFAKPTNEPAP
jgi:cell division protein FtsB